MTNQLYWHPTPVERPNCAGQPCGFITLNRCLHIMLIKTLALMSMRSTPPHLFGLERSPLFGTGTTWPSCHSTKSSLSSQNFRMNSNRWSKFSAVIALKALGGTTFNLGALLLVRSTTTMMNSAHSGGGSSSCIASRRLMPLIILVSVGSMSFKTLSK